MSFYPKLTITSSQLDASEITVVDSTGNKADNGTGYGTGNPAKVDITDVILQLFSLNRFGEESLIKQLQLESGDRTDVLAAGVTFTAADWLSGETFPDNIYKFKYFQGYNTAITITYTAGSKILSPSTPIPADVAGFSIPSYDADKIFMLDKTRPQAVYVTEALPALDDMTDVTIKLYYQGAGHFGFWGDSYLCLIKDIANWSADECSDAYHELQKRLMINESLPVKMTKELYLQAADMLFSYVNSCKCQ